MASLRRAEWGPDEAGTSTHPSGTGSARTLGELRSIPDFDARTASLSVKNELRRNLLRAIETGEPLFPGVHGYEDTVVPQIVNALLSRHNFILLGLRGQAKSRILRGLAQSARSRNSRNAPDARSTTIRCAQSAAPAASE